MKNFCRIFAAALALLMISGCGENGGSVETTAPVSTATECSRTAEFGTEAASVSETATSTDGVENAYKTTASSSKAASAAEKSSAAVKASEKITEKATAQKASEKATQKPTAAATQAPDKGDGVIIGLKLILFGCGRDEIISALGNPDETVSEQLKSGEKIESLVYAESYARLAVIQLCDGSFSAIYTVARDTVITDGSSSMSLRTGGETQIGKTRIQVYVDGENGGKVYALWARHGGFSCEPSELRELGGQERLIFHATNGVRAINGLAPLKYSQQASESARLHCEDMAERDYFAHDTPEGITCAERMSRRGIIYTACGENLGAGYMGAFDLVDGWYNSHGHRLNMLASDYEYIGVAMTAGNERYSFFSAQNYYG